MLNSKLLKNLRSTVRRIWPDAPARALVMGRPNVRLLDSGVLNPDGTPKMIPWQYTGTLRNSPDSQRGRYRMAKKLAAKGLLQIPA
jgi:hypothetical protein